MSFALAVADLASPSVYEAFAASSEPPILGIVTKIGPTVIVYQDGREQTYTVSSPVDTGLSKVVPNLSSDFLNRKVRGNGTVPFPNLDGRGNGTCVQVVTVTNTLQTAAETAIVRFDWNGLYVAIPVAFLEVVPGQ